MLKDEKILEVMNQKNSIDFKNNNNFDMQII